MTEVLWILTGSASAFAGVLLGRRIGRKEIPPPEPKPSLICGCEHELAMHDPKEGRCHETERISKYNNVGRPVGYTEVQCRCRQYTGARPLETYWTPPIYQEED